MAVICGGLGLISYIMQRRVRLYRGCDSIWQARHLRLTAGSGPLETEHCSHWSQSCDRACWLLAYLTF